MFNKDLLTLISPLVSPSYSMNPIVEFVHEEIDVGTARAGHLRERFLIDPGNQGHEHQAT
jgi:hypothetical protein